MVLPLTILHVASRDEKQTPPAVVALAIALELSIMVAAMASADPDGSWLRGFTVWVDWLGRGMLWASTVLASACAALALLYLSGGCVRIAASLGALTCVALLSARQFSIPPSPSRPYARASSRRCSSLG